MHSLWIRIPAYIIGAIIFGLIGFYGFMIFADTWNRNKKQRYLGGLVAVFAMIAFPAYLAAWNEKRVVAAFAELFVAFTLILISSFGAIIVGYLSGKKIYLKTSKIWLGWLIGILIGLTMSVSLRVICSDIPGIGWRMEKISEYY